MSLCEFLPQLGTLSIKIPLKDDDTTPTISEIAFTEERFVLTTENHKYSVQLPLLSSDKSEQPKITHLSADKGVVAIKVKLSQPVSGQSTFTSLASSKFQRWSVKDLTKTPKDKNNVNQFRFLCAHCGASVVNSEDSKFTDMPSEYWHELMEFWHCHKPHQTHHENHDKNYGNLRPKPGHVYIGASYLLLNRETSECSGCKRQLGETSSDGAKLYKWNLSLAYGDVLEKFPPYAFAYYAILDRINSGAFRKLQLKSTSGSLSLWVLSVGLSVSYDDFTLNNALKILYDNRDDSDLETIEVPSEVFESVQRVLQESNASLPENERMTSIKNDQTPRNIAYLAPEMTKS